MTGIEHTIGQILVLVDRFQSANLNTNNAVLFIPSGIFPEFPHLVQLHGMRVVVTTNVSKPHIGLPVDD